VAPEAVEDVTHLVLVRHGEAICNVEGVVGGPKGCTGLTSLGRAQAEMLAERLARTGELGHVQALYASVLPRAIDTARILAPALAGADGNAAEVRPDCALCELHPGDADGLTWAEYLARFEQPDWYADPTRPFATRGEDWTSFVERASAALERLVASHRGQTVVVVTHAGVVEASMLRFLPVDPRIARLGLHTVHASLTVWQHLRTGDGVAEAGGDTQRPWSLERYNDAASV
jgi:2,3-bisphosphoglycerate-dependent phosphoglycerate mutase